MALSHFELVHLVKLVTVSNLQISVDAYKIIFDMEYLVNLHVELNQYDQLYPDIHHHLGIISINNINLA